MTRRRRSTHHTHHRRGRVHGVGKIRHHRRRRSHRKSHLLGLAMPEGGIEKVLGIGAGAVASRFLDKPIDSIVSKISKNGIAPERELVGAAKVVAGMFLPGMIAKGNKLAGYAGDGLIAVGMMELAEGLKIFGPAKSLNGPYDIDGIGEEEYALMGPDQGGLGYDAGDYYLHGPDQGGLGDQYSGGGIYGPDQGGLGEVYDGGLGNYEYGY